VSAFNYSLYPNTHLLHGFGGEAALNYTFFFNANWGIGTGAGFALYNGAALLSGTTISSVAAIGDQQYELRTVLHTYEEQQRLLAPNVPLFVQYEIAGKHHFYARLGGKLVLPMFLPFTYEVKNAHITSTAFDGDVRQPENASYGWGDYTNIKHSGSFTLNMGVMLSAEVGTKWRLSRKFSLYTGVYFDYGAFLDMHPAADKEPFVTSATSKNPHFSMSSIIQSQNGATNWAGAPLTKTLSPVAAGIVVRLSFGMVPIPAARHVPDIVDTLVKLDSVFIPVHDTVTVTVTKTETIYRELTCTTTGDASPGALLVRRDTVMIYNEHHHYRTDTINRYVADTVRVVRYRQTYVISNFLASATYVSGEKKATLDHAIAMLLSHPKATVIIEGHTCNSGAPNANMALGLRRAQIVAKYLLQNGIASTRVKVVSKGDTEPIVPNDGEYNRSRNRRVKLIIVDKSGNGY
jgi:hypothetical protein